MTVDADAPATAEQLAELERELRVLRKRLDRAQADRAFLEQLKEENEQRLRTVISDKDSANAELERLAEELAAARAEALDQSENKSRFLAHMSHEIRTPLNGVVGLVELLTDTSVSAEQQELVRMLTVACDNLLAIVDDVLDLAIVEADTVSIDSEVYEPRRVLEEVGDILALKAEERGIRLVTHVVPGLPERVHGDSGRLRQILVNLATNAIKFTGTGRVLLRAYFEPRPVHDDSVRNRRLWLVFDVDDTGPGIPKHRLESVFEPFTRGPGDAGGAGLGLSIAKRLAQAMGGDLEVAKSEPGQGSIFRCRLPVKVAAREGRRAHLPRGTLILALVGDRAQALALQADLRTLGAEVQLVRTLEALEERLARNTSEALQVSAAILDTQEVGLSPPVVAHAPPGLPLIALTSLRQRMTLSTTAHRAETPAWASALTWPVRIDALAACVASVSGRSTRSPVGDGAPRDAEASDALAESPPTLPNGRVLVVEDDPINRRLAVRLLEKRNIPFDLAQDGKEAVEAAARQRYAVILMDCRMPVMDGFEATRRIRRGPGKNEDTPIVALTANAVVSERRNCLDAGMNEVLGKPIRSELLYDAIGQWSARRSK